MEKERLQKYLAQCGIASRRKAEELIAAGRVSVNGRKASIGDSIDPRRDRITLDGKTVETSSGERRYILLNKPRGVVTTMQDEQGRRCVADLVKDIGGRVYPVGRLDKDSEGLLLLTNDGAFANAVMHPSKHIPKTYRVTVRPSVTDEQLISLKDGMVIDGVKTAPASVTILEEQPGRVVLQIVLREGRNRQIRKMCFALGLTVARLKRTAIGPIRLGMLAPGRHRDLTKIEVRQLLRGQKAKDEETRAGTNRQKGASRND